MFVLSIFCKHKFRLSEMQNRKTEGNKRIKWPCAKCGKIFYAHCGVDIIGVMGGQGATLDAIANIRVRMWRPTLREK